jgi:DNA repair exonuclease SbcCD ATPase subunit
LHLQVDDRVKQQWQQTVAATQSATAATYISKEAAHEVGRVALQVQQLSAGAKPPSGSSASAAPVAIFVSAAGEDASPVPACEEARPETSSETAVSAAVGADKQLQQLEEAMKQLRQHVEDTSQQLLTKLAALQEQQSADVIQFAQQLTNSRQQMDAESSAASKQYEAQQQAQAAAAEEQLQQLAQVREQSEQQQAGLLEVQQQLGAQGTLLQQLQEASVHLSALQQQVEQHAQQLAATASASALEQCREQLQQLSAAGTELQQQQMQHVAACAAVSAVQDQHQAGLNALQQQLEQTTALTGTVSDLQQQLAAAQAQLTQQTSQVDEQAGVIFSLRVDLQNGLQELGDRLASTEGFRGDMDIWEDSMKAAAGRTEAAAAEALEKVGQTARHNRCYCNKPGHRSAYRYSRTEPQHEQGTTGGFGCPAAIQSVSICHACTSGPEW